MISPVYFSKHSFVIQLGKGPGVLNFDAGGLFQEGHGLVLETCDSYPHA